LVPDGSKEIGVLPSLPVSIPAPEEDRQFSIMQLVSERAGRIHPALAAKQYAIARGELLPLASVHPAGPRCHPPSSTPPVWELRTQLFRARFAQKMHDFRQRDLVLDRLHVMSGRLRPTGWLQDDPSVSAHCRPLAD